MGDRANIVIKDDFSDGEVFLYTHWGGYEYEDVLRTALAKRWRWTDSSYLARIIFAELTKGSEGDEGGFGISASMGDNSYPLLVVDCEKQEVRWETENDRAVEKRQSFEDFIKTEINPVP